MAACRDIGAPFKSAQFTRFPRTAQGQAAYDGPCLTEPGTHHMKLEKISGRSAAIRVGDIIYASGQAAVGGDGCLVGADDFDLQARQAFENVERVLLANGTTMNRVIKVTLFLTSMNDAPKMLALRRLWFAPPYPAESMVEVSALHVPGAKIVVDVIAAWAGPQAAF
ncbi:hypothetical protein RugamoR1_40440 [Rugamonas sp. R1(2021)]